MKYEIIGSSSKGNCVIIEDFLMLDCGLSYKTIKNRLRKIKIIFISHCHSDHLNTNTLKLIAYNYPTIKILTGSLEVVQKLKEINFNARNIYYICNRHWNSLGMLKVCLEPLKHDAYNCLLKWQYNDKKGIYIVDTANVDNVEAKDYDLYLVESNYKEDILQRHIDEITQDNAGDLKYLSRVPETHLSWEQCNDFLLKNMKSESQYEYLHQSEYNYEKEII